MDVRVGLFGKLNAEELMFLNCGVGKDLIVAVVSFCFSFWEITT